MSLEHKFCAVGADVTVTGGSVISGYASLFGQADQGGDTVLPGAYAGSLAQGRQIKMLWQHDPAQPIGVWDEVREDDNGLWVKGRLLTDVAKGREAASLVAAGAIDGLSIGYRTVKAQKNDKGGRLLSQLELWEVSLVTFPMLRDARVAAKGDDLAAGAMRDLAAVFDDARRLMARD
ncbi:HK97 family phage prohead protease [Loktanella sp. D2R18]|uniref:HK97 family phage prohead protease n=1 Tax=Rhodobacterales TaxID=204455 RepID=UPI000DEA29E1|nr:MULTISPECIES: HK97 family phage prohead protease [Rhodobacterales]MDO6589724.1 HK97 family phage prohead protease [Yoonia sp. 1_MG-2023]RBW44349.1 HK97 family phage prohead protease [Loktanella sp. D2R18]